MASNTRAVDPAEKRIAVLIIREGLGDALLKIPFLRAVRRAFPGHRIWWIATHQTAMEDDLAPWVAPLLDRVISQAGLTSPDREIIPRLRALPPFDLVFNSRSRFMTLLLTRLNLKHHGYYACAPGFLLSDRPPPGRWMRPTGIAARMLTMIEAATGRAADWKGTFDVCPAAQQLAAARIRMARVMSDWRRAAAKFARTGRWSDTPRSPLRSPPRATHRRSCIGPQERAWLDTLRAAVPQALFPEADPVDPSLGIGRLEFAIALGRRLTAVVANDSGVGHLMAAIGTPLVSLFGPSDAKRWAPFGEHVIILRAQEFGGETMESIPVEAVSGAVDRLLEGSSG